MALVSKGHVTNRGMKQHHGNEFGPSTKCISLINIRRISEEGRLFCDTKQLLKQVVKLASQGRLRKQFHDAGSQGGTIDSLVCAVFAAGLHTKASYTHLTGHLFRVARDLIIES